MTSPEHFGGMRGTPTRWSTSTACRRVYDDHTTDQQYSTDLLAAELRAFIADAASQGRPFFAVWTPYASHAELPYLLPEPAAAPLSASSARCRPGDRRALPRRTCPTSRASCKVLPQGSPSTIILTDLIRIGAYETLLSVDEQLQVLLDDLVQLGIDRNTVILVTSDNGVGLGRAPPLLPGQGVPVRGMPARADDRARPAHRRRRRRPTTRRCSTSTSPRRSPSSAGVVPPVPTDGTSFAAWVAGSPPPRSGATTSSSSTGARSAATPWTTPAR